MISKESLIKPVTTSILNSKHQEPKSGLEGTGTPLKSVNFYEVKAYREQNARTGKL